MANKPENEKTFLELLVDYGRSGTVPPIDAPTKPTQPPTTPPPAPLPRLVLTEREKYGEALYQSGGYAAIMEYFTALKRFAERFK